MKTKKIDVALNMLAASINIPEPELAQLYALQSIAASLAILAEEVATDSILPGLMEDDHE